jgi:replicative DNA helicase
MRDVELPFDQSTQSSDPLMRVTPHNIGIEEAWIAMLFMDSSLIDKAIEGGITHEYFYSTKCRIIYSTITNLWKSNNLNEEGGVDELSIAQELRNLGMYDEVGGLQEVTRISSKAETATYFETYMGYIQGFHHVRSLIGVCNETLDAAYSNSPVKSLLADVDQKVSSISMSALAVKSIHDSKEVAANAKEIIRQRKENQGVAGVTTGLEDLDGILKGFKPAELTYLVARPSTGKTALSLHITKHAAQHFGSVLYFSIEMSHDQLGCRMIQAESGVPFRLMDDGLLNQNQEAQIDAAGDRIGELPIYIDDFSSPTMSHIRSRARRFANIGLRLIVVDYMQLIQTENPRTSREQQVAEISRGLKALAKDLKVPVLCLGQLNRDIEKGGNRKPKLSDIRESGQAEQDADVVLALWQEKPDIRDCVDCAVLKQRNGPIGDIKINYQRMTQRFSKYIMPKMENSDVPTSGAGTTHSARQERTFG